MLKFFRKIRFKLMSENKTSRYFKYAVGEIVLVVIGILIALQINNWNSNLIAQDKETELLKELISGLKADKQILQAETIKYTADLKELKTLDSLLNNPNYPYHESLNSLFGQVYGIRFNRINTAFYEDFKSNGLQVIRNKNIRSKVVDLFENNYKIVNQHLEIEMSTNDVIRPYYLKNFKNLLFRAYAIPIHYKKVWQDPYYKNIVSYRILNIKLNQIRDYNKTMNDIDTIVSLVQNYLNND